MGFSRQKYWSRRLPFPSPRDLLDPGIEPASLASPELAGGFFTTELPDTCVCVCVCVFVTQSCPTLCDPVDCSPSGSSVHGILQAVILEWVAIPFSRDLPNPEIGLQSPTLQADSLSSEPPGKPIYIYRYISISIIYIPIHVYR